MKGDPLAQIRVSDTI